MSKAVKAIRYLLVNDSTIGGLVSTRCYPVDGVPKNTSLPYLVLTRVSDRPDVDLNGRTDQRIALLNLEIVSRTYATAATISAAVPNAVNGGDRTVNGVVLTETAADDAGDQPDGPVDLDDGEGFVATVEINIAYVP
jgi:hypothetical protein